MYLLTNEKLKVLGWPEPWKERFFFEGAFPKCRGVFGENYAAEQLVTTVTGFCYTAFPHFHAKLKLAICYCCEV